MKLLIILTIVLLLIGIPVLAQSVTLMQAGLLPDNPFHPFQDFFEQLQLFFAFSPEAKANIHLQLAEKRLAELNLVIEQNKTDLVPILSDKFKKELNDTENEINSAKALGQNVTEITQHVAGETFKHQLVLQNLLDKVPEQARPSIGNAINKSQEGYIAAVESILESGNATGNVNMTFVVGGQTFTQTFVVSSEHGKPKILRGGIVGGENENISEIISTTTTTTTTIANAMSYGLGALPEVIPDEARVVPYTAGPLPTHFDWRQQNGYNWMTPVKSQAGCGSCVAFGVVAALEGQLRTAANNSSWDVDLSEQHLFSCGGGSCASGWYVSRALNYLEQNGTPDEVCSPYQGRNGSCSASCPDWQSRSFKITSWNWILATPSAIEAALQNGPLVARFDVYQDFVSYYYTSPVYHYDGHSAFAGGHAVAIVGYDSVEQYWIAKNSWGENWGENGYFKIGFGEVGIEQSVASIRGVRVPTNSTTPPPPNAYVTTTSITSTTTTTTAVVCKSQANQWVVTDKSLYSLGETAIISVPATCIFPPCIGASLSLLIYSPDGSSQKIAIPADSNDPSGRTPLPVSFYLSQRGTYYVQYLSQVSPSSSTVLACATFIVQ